MGLAIDCMRPEQEDRWVGHKDHSSAGLQGVDKNRQPSIEECDFWNLPLVLLAVVYQILN